VSASGFENAEIVQKHDIFEGVPNPSSALEYGTQGISLRARKPLLTVRAFPAAKGKRREG